MQIIHFMITNGKGWKYIEIKQLHALLRAALL